MRVSAVLALLAAACAGAPPQGVDPLGALAAAEEALGEGQPQRAVQLLEAFDVQDYAGEDRERYVLRLATALHRAGESWDAFEVIRDFPKSYPVSRFVEEVADLEFAIGRALITSDWSFLFFASDADDGQAVLEHFTQVYPWHDALPDALRLLGQKAFAEGAWNLARQRFEQLVLARSDSEWIPLARYSIAMARYRALSGPDYDLAELERAHNELRDFLSSGIENVRFQRSAQEALAVVRGWLAVRHVHVADFYARVGNERGERHHLKLAAERYPETIAGKNAAARLRRASGEEDSR